MDDSQSVIPINASESFDLGQPRTELISRQTILRLLQTGNQCGETRFVQRAALHWLASYPGDLGISLMYAQAMQHEGRLTASASVLRGLGQADPQYEEAVRTLMEVEGALQLAATAQRSSSSAAGMTGLGRDKEYYHNWLAALGAPPDFALPDAEPAKQSNEPEAGVGWGEQVFRLRQDLAAGEFALVEKRLPRLLANDPKSPLIALAHMEVLSQIPGVPLPAKRSLAENYRRQFPDCLGLSLIYADALIHESSSELGVALLHQVAARDISGQVVKRLWGAGHPYTSLWPGHMEIVFDLQVPPAVVQLMGWNRLAAGSAALTPLVGFEAAVIEMQSPSPEEDRSHTLLAGATIAAINDEARDSAAPGTAVIAGQNAPAGIELEPDFAAAAVATATVKVIEPIQYDADEDTNFQPIGPDEEIVSIREELDQIALRLKQPDLTGVDGRFPVYVIFSVQSKLESRYGTQAAAEIVSEMGQLTRAIKQRSSGDRGERWGARVFLPDNKDNIAQFNLHPVAAADPWTLKLALRDLDAALARSGEMIGALLIIGGPEIVPFHNLPNPVDDPDHEIPSDNPYGTRDENYFITEWPVGRLPGGKSSSPEVLLANLKAVTQAHTPAARPVRRVKRILAWLTGWLQPSRRGQKPSLGYTAAVWRQASASVYRPIGETRSLLVSPPMGVNGSSPNGRDKIPLPTARLGYFNLHGLADSGEWYGQKDPGDNTQDPDFPVALRPQDVRSMQPNLPQVVFTEACYGANILDKSNEDALALQFLQAGSQVVVGSTVVSYGSISAPLIAADLLGFLFWKGFQDGQTAGEALRRGRIQLANEMHSRQGYLDGEDQKTLVSFVLYGDPLARNSNKGKAAKRVHRTIRPAIEVQTVCDRVDDPAQAVAVPQEVIAHVKRIAGAYLPGMNDAQMTYSVERAVCAADGHACPTHQMQSKSHQAAPPGRHVVVLSKSFTKADHTHQKIARLTLDENGKLVKMVVSR